MAYLVRSHSQGLDPKLATFEKQLVTSLRSGWVVNTQNLNRRYCTARKTWQIAKITVLPFSGVSVYLDWKEMSVQFGANEWKYSKATCCDFLAQYKHNFAWPEVDVFLDTDHFSSGQPDTKCYFGSSCMLIFISVWHLTLLTFVS